MDSSPNRSLSDGEKEENDSQKSIDMGSSQGLDDILTQTSLYMSSSQGTDGELSTPFNNDMQYDPDSGVSKSESQKKKESKSKKELEEEEREKMQYVKV